MSVLSPLEFESKVVEDLASYLAELAGFAESTAWRDIYLDAVDCLRDVLAAWRGEVDL